MCQFSNHTMVFTWCLRMFCCGETKWLSWTKGNRSKKKLDFTIRPTKLGIWSNNFGITNTWGSGQKVWFWVRKTWILKSEIGIWATNIWTQVRNIGFEVTKPWMELTNHVSFTSQTMPNLWICCGKRTFWGFTPQLPWCLVCVASKPTKIEPGHRGRRDRAYGFHWFHGHDEALGNLC